MQHSACLLHIARCPNVFLSEYNNYHLAKMFKKLFSYTVNNGSDRNREEEGRDQSAGATVSQPQQKKLTNCSARLKKKKSFYKLYVLQGGIVGQWLARSPHRKKGAVSILTQAFFCVFCPGCAPPSS